MLLFYVWIYQKSYLFMKALYILCHARVWTQYKYLLLNDDESGLKHLNIYVENTKNNHYHSWVDRLYINNKICCACYDYTVRNAQAVEIFVLKFCLLEEKHGLVLVSQ